MAAPKKPQDRKPKQTTAVEVMGVIVDIPRKELAARITDWEVAEGVAISQDPESTESERMVATVKIMRRVFGEQYEQIKRELRAANDGDLSVSTMAKFMSETFKALAPNS